MGEVEAIQGCLKSTSMAAEIIEMSFPVDISKFAILNLNFRGNRRVWQSGIFDRPPPPIRDHLKGKLDEYIHRQ